MYMYIYIYVCTYIYIYICVCVRVCVCANYAVQWFGAVRRLTLSTSSGLEGARELGISMLPTSHG